MIRSKISLLGVGCVLNLFVCHSAMSMDANANVAIDTPKDTPKVVETAYLKSSGDKLFVGLDDGVTDNIDYTMYSLDNYQDSAGFSVPKSSCALGAVNGFLSLDPKTGKISIFDASNPALGLHEIDAQSLCGITPEPH